MPYIAAATTQPLATRHEALWLSLTALHKDVVALAARKPATAVSDPVRIAAESLFSDAVPFLPRPKARLPVAAPDLAGLAVQLGQVLAWLDAWESRHTVWDAGRKCHCWRLGGGDMPVLRLRPKIPPPPTTYGKKDVRSELLKRIEQRRAGDFESGFQAGRAARQGKPVAEIEAEAQQTYPHIRPLE